MCRLSQTNATGIARLSGVLDRKVGQSIHALWVSIPAYIQ